MSLEFTQAIECYTLCLDRVADNDLELRKIVFSNRAQSYIKLKKWKEAESDAD